jgi:predicted HNH restriction endonuclease
LEERLQKTIASTPGWPELKELEKNIKNKGALTEEVQRALRRRSTELAIPFIQERTGLDLSSLSPAERKIVEAVGEYVGILREQGKYPGRTLEQLKNRNLLGAVEIAVAKKRPTQGYQILADANLEELSYEQIVVGHVEEFSPRALWFSRRTLGLASRWQDPPAPLDGKRQQATEKFLTWLAKRAETGGGFIEPFTNAERFEGMGYEQDAGKAAGAVQSRVDFACFQLALPPLGLIALTPYEAWGYDGKGPWAFPVGAMTNAARDRHWSADDFARILAKTRELPEVAPLWVAPEMDDERREWAAHFGSTVPGEDAAVAQVAKKERNEDWMRDELILALDLYMRHRSSPLGKEAPEILELSALLVKLGEILDAQRTETYRNANGVYMKIMNFRRMDPQYTASGKVGLGRGNKLEAVVWNEFAADPERLAEVASAIRSSIESTEIPRGEWTQEEEEQTGQEGRLLTRLHRYRERDGKLSRRKKEHVLKETGKILCEGCDLDSEKKYGTAGIGVEAHHTQPLHTLAVPKTTRLSDLALLCATCHRVLHAHKPWLTVPQLRVLVESRKKGK